MLVVNRGRFERWGHLPPLDGGYGSKPRGAAKQIRPYGAEGYILVSTNWLLWLAFRRTNMARSIGVKWHCMSTFSSLKHWSFITYSVRHLALHPLPPWIKRQQEIFVKLFRQGQEGLIAWITILRLWFMPQTRPWYALVSGMYTSGHLIVDLHPVSCRARKLTDQTPLGGNFSKKQVATKESRELW